MGALGKHKLVVIVAVLLIAGVAWYFLSGSSASSAPSPVLTTTTVAGGADQDLVSTLLALKAVRLDGTILSNAAFLSLKDFSTQIIPEPVGRQNPFAPLSVAASSSANSVHAAQLFTPKR